MSAKTKPTELASSNNNPNNDNSSNVANTNSWLCSENGTLSLENITKLVYICQGLSFLFGITAIAGFFLNYLKRDAVKDSWLESHFAWQLRTFWIGLSVAVLGFLLTIILVGFLILVADLVWIIYRVVKGGLLLLENKPIENSTDLI